MMLKEIEDLAKEVHKVLLERDHETLANKLKDVCSALGINVKEADICVCGHARKDHCTCGTSCIAADWVAASRCYCAGYLLK